MRRFVIPLLTAVMLAGCGSLSVFRQDTDPIDRDAGGDISPMAERSPVPHAVTVLLFMERLMQASADTLAIMPSARAAPSGRPHAALHHALWLATPGHPGNNPAAARDALQALLQPDVGLDAPVRALVQLQLRELERTESLRQDSADLQRANRRLSAKLKALTDLERQMGQDETDEGSSQ